MLQLTPSQVYDLSDAAYKVRESASRVVRRDLARDLTFVDLETLEVVSATSGLGLRALSGFGFMAQLKGSRSKEIVIATRGTAQISDVATNLNMVPSRGPTGHLIHMGFGNTFKSYVQQMKEFIHQQNLGFRPTAVHCMGHSLGGALANLNAAACAELGFNAHLYSVAAPRVGLVPYAEHLSKKMNPEHVHRVANEADVVTMVPCYPFVHAPYIHGTHLLDGGMLAVNPLQHKLDTGYVSMRNSSWKQLQSASQCRQQQLENDLRLIRGSTGYFETMARMQGAFFSGRLLKIINMAINDLMTRLGAQSLLSVSGYRTGAFTVLDQLSEMLARYAQGCLKRGKEMLGLLNAVMAYLGRGAGSVVDATVATIRWVFGLLLQSVSTMAKMALDVLGR
jgi:triacylglycerol lipase